MLRTTTSFYSSSCSDSMLEIENESQVVTALSCRYSIPKLNDFISLSNATGAKQMESRLIIDKKLSTSEL